MSVTSKSSKHGRERPPMMLDNGETGSHNPGQSQSARIMMSKSLNSLDVGLNRTSSNLLIPQSQITAFITKAQSLYNNGAYTDCLTLCEKIYDLDTYRTDNLLLIGAVHFQLRNYSESVFYNQQCIKVDPHFAEAFNNLGNALKELGDLKGATQFYLKVS
jgi:tetratricopeptide (TPR) repeat protein